MSSANRIFQSLRGKWTFTRMISDQGKIEGTAIFKEDLLDKNFLHYKEEGIFKVDDGKTHATYRDYYYRLIGEQICVYFTEKPERLFQTLIFADTSPLTATASHLCIADTYDAIYTFTAQDAFSLCYRVKGPQKDYSIQTHFKR